MSALQWAQVALYYLAAIALGHLLHELVHVAVARAVGCKSINFHWPHITIDGTTFQTLAVAVTPSLIGIVGGIIWYLYGTVYLAVPTVVAVIFIVSIIFIGRYICNRIYKTPLLVWILVSIILLAVWFYGGGSTIAGAVSMPHPVWFALVALSISGRDDLLMAIRSIQDLRRMYRVARGLRQ